MNRIITIVSLSVFLGACSAPDNVGNENSEPLLGAALAGAVDTKSLSVSKDFGFETAKTINVNFDLADAQNEEATVTICSDYLPVGNEFDINFDSCTVSGPLESGVFEHSMEVTIDKTSVVAGVFFQDASIDPMFKEFSVDDGFTTRAKGDSQTLVWHE